MKIKGCLSRQSDEWETPQKVFDELNDEFCFTLDPCATEANHKCEKFFTKEDDGLSKDWGGASRVLQPAVLKDRQVG
jgi:site-specific DNA-methyltransferase (adenine-specific)